MFETVCIYGGKVFRLNRHLERLFGGLGTLRFKIPYNESSMAQSLTELIRRNQITNGFARIILTRGVSDFGLGTKSSRDPVVVMYASHASRSQPNATRVASVSSSRKERANAQSVMEVTKTISRVHHVSRRWRPKRRVRRRDPCKHDGHSQKALPATSFSSKAALIDRTD